MQEKMQSTGMPGCRRMIDKGTRVPCDACLARTRASDDGKVIATPGELGNAPPSGARDVLEHFCEVLTMKQLQVN